MSNLETATLRDGQKLNLGDEVTTDFHEKCKGIVFVVCEINLFSACESGALVVVHRKDDPTVKIKGLKRELHNFVDGIDANWFKKIE